VTTVEERAGDEFDAAVVDAATARAQRWWLEIPLAVLFYAVYARIRDWNGSATSHHVTLARNHGYDVLRAEKWLHLDLEKGAQTVFLPAHGLIRAMNVFYGTAHFLITLGVFVWLLLASSPAFFRRARNVLAIGTAIGLVCFALYPTMPPRLMPPGVNTVDTMDVVGGLWSYNRGVLEHIADPFAAMPSLHIVWSSWVAYVIWSRLNQSSHRRWRHVAWLYPAATALIVVVTGTHWVLDLVGGAVVFVAALWGARRLDVIAANRAQRRAR
jgi:PAP2 superfamily